MSILAAVAASAVFGLIVGRLSAWPTIRRLHAVAAALRGRVETLDRMLRVAEYVVDHDRLTGLPNRSYAAKVFTMRALLRRATVVVLVDLDRFKHINDTYGHHVGDDLLRITAERLAHAAKATGGTAARLGGDEFLLLLPADDHATQVAAILEQLADPLTLSADDGDVTLRPQASAGIAIHDGGFGTFDVLLHHADIALYHAKQQRGSHRTYRTDLRMPRNAGRHGPRRRDERPTRRDGHLGDEVTA